MSEPSTPEQPAVDPPARGARAAAQPTRSSKRWRRAALGALLLSTSTCCGFVALRSCAMSPGSEEQSAAREVAQQYLDAVSAHDWARSYELSSPAMQSAQPLDAQERIFGSHPELFEFEDASFEGYSYFASMTGGDRIQLTGRLTGPSSARRTFRLDMQQLDDGSWRVLAFNVNLELGAQIPAATAAPSEH